VVLYLSSIAVRAQESSRISHEDPVFGISFLDKNPPAQLRDPFSKGNLELEVLGGGDSSTLYPGARRPRITFLSGDVRLGLMITNIVGRSFYRGNFEILLDGFAAEVTNGPGSWLAGGRILGRYNFAQPGARVVPYLQYSVAHSVTTSTEIIPNGLSVEALNLRSATAWGCVS
jgi:hypothetical protein